MSSRLERRIGMPVSRIGYGMWGMGGWTGSDDEASARALDRAVELGCTFFDTALAYGEGHSERLLGALLRRHGQRRLCVATKVPPKNRRWPGLPSSRADDVFPYDHVMASVHASLDNLGVPCIDLLQLHVWDDSWTGEDGWRRALDDLQREGRVRACGISVNRWEPENVLRALDTGLVDAVQVVYNIFDQAPEDVLFPACHRLDVAVIARVPFDEGSLTGTLRADSRWPDGDWRNIYFGGPHLAETLSRLPPLQAIAAGEGIDLPTLALRFVLDHPAVTSTIPGMRRAAHVESNMAAANGRLRPDTISALRAHRWDRVPDERP